MKYFFCYWILFSGIILVNNLHAQNQSTSEELAAYKQKFIETAPSDTKQDFEKGIQYVASSGVLESAVNVGDHAPNFELPNALGKQVTLSDLLTQGPVVIVWYRGGWCPYCNIYLHGLQKRLPEIKESGGQLVAISPELPTKALTTQEKQNLKYHVLSDVGNETALDYGIMYKLPNYVIKHYSFAEILEEYGGDQSYTLPLSAAYVVDRSGNIAYAYLDADYRNRAPIDDLINAVKNLR